MRSIDSPRSKRLTDIAIKAAKPPTGKPQIELPDGVVPGLALRVSRDGSKTFTLRYRDNSGRQHRMTLGRYPDLKLEDARRLALANRGDVAKGHNPAEKKRRAKVATISELVSEFVLRHASNNRSAKETERILNKEFVAKLGKNRDISTIKRADIIKIIDGIADRGMAPAARNALAAIRKCLNWAVSRDLLDSSPAQGVKPPAPPSRRDRTLTDDELAAIWRATFEEDWRFNQFVRLLILTGQRRAQIAGLRWSWIDFNLAIINFPADTMKNKAEFALPMSDSVVTLLRGIKRQPIAVGEPDELDDRVFPTRTASNSESTISGYSKAKARLDKKSGVVDWTYHDFRRTISTYLNGPAKVPPHIVERILSHKLLGVAGVYNKWDYLDEKREALELWAAHPSLKPIESMTKPQPERAVTTTKRTRGRPRNDPEQEAIMSAAVQMYHSATRRMKAEERAVAPDGSKSTPSELADEETADDLALSVGTMRRLNRRPRRRSQK